MIAKDVQKELRVHANKDRAKTNAWFFKTGKGQYGEGDKFIGVSNPDARKIARKYQRLPFTEVLKLLNSKIHEERFVGLEILVTKYEKSNIVEKRKVVTFYLKNRKKVNNWDLVDTSASYILGQYLFDKDRSILYKLINSKSLWDRRIAVIATHYFIKQKDYKEILLFSLELLNDKEDLIHKAVGWMLREVGKQNKKVLRKFLDQYSKVLPRTTLRYAIERLPSVQRNKYMKR